MKIRVGILGYKNAGKLHYNELIRSDKFDLCGVYDNSKIDFYCRAEVFDDFKSFIEVGQPEAIVICLNEDEIFDAFCECVKYCKNILICSPFCKNQDELSQMKYLATQHDTTVALGFKTRFNQAVFSLKKALLKEEEIFNINIFNCIDSSDANIINELTLGDIDIAKFLANSEITELNSSFTNVTNQKRSDNAMLKIKFKNQILTSITNSLTSAISSHFITINATSGVYYCNILLNKLHQINQDGQINLKVNSEISEQRSLYNEFYTLVKTQKNENIPSLDDAIKIRGLLR
ncbi:MAG: Gfo/Idh/MocA family oxidoreductase [Campylobacter sp.]|nr:Gfo/Idh/MocA family oxidoreductase [Campylobacter sp.]